MTYEKRDTLLKLEKVNMVLGGRQILRDVDAEIKDIVREGHTQGQVVCFLGPSGIGKSVLSRIIAGLWAPTSGKVTLVGGKPVRKGLVGMVPQNYLLFDFATVRENFAIAAKQSPNGKGPAKLKDYVERFHLERFMDLYPGQLSGGTRQRVAIVRQLLCSEHLLIMDEPFSGLDPIMKQRACGLISEVAAMDELHTIILVTHDVTEGMSVADTVWLMGREPGLPGARIVAEYDLAAMEMCWSEHLLADPKFLGLVAGVKERFKTLV
jgi:ABC-type nitrate/sulfonate/bicarbonate transport system ATPase subunit